MPSQPFSRVAVWAAAAAMLGVPRSGAADSNIDPEHRIAWGTNIGPVDWRPSLSAGAVVGEFVCSGFLYSPSIGWISLGNGQPVDHIRYGNSTAEDFGVNNDGHGNLRGYAYGANVGWIAFEDVGSPRVDLASGRLSGFIYGANIGWIRLSGSTLGIRVTSIFPGADADHDGLPDAWELTYTSTIGILTTGADTDGDGGSDDAEYRADTNPLDPSDSLRILSVSLSDAGNTVTLEWTARPTRQYWVDIWTDLDANPARVDVGMGPDFAGSGTRSMSSSLPAPEHAFFRVLTTRPQDNLPSPISDLQH